MTVLIVYDSYFGNTEKVAISIGQALGPGENVCISKVSEVKPEQLQGVTLFIAGSPTRAFRPSEGMQKFLKGLPEGSLKGVRVAAFDTRINPEETKSSILRFMVKLFGYAAKPIADGLQKKGGSLTGQPEGFYVKESEGPLKDGELDRAAAWAKGLK